MSLKQNTLIVFLEKHSLILLGFISTLILARLLSPTEIGLVSVALGISGIAHMLRDFGIGQYLVQEKELTNEKVQAAFSITLTVAWILGGALYLSSFWITTFYNEQRLEEIIQVMSVNFLILPFGSIGVSLLRREMLFKRLYFINTIPQIFQTISSIALAYLDFSYMSLVYANLLGTGLTVILSIILAPSTYKRGINFSHLKHVIGYSTSAMSTNFLMEINYSAPDFIISRALGFDSAAIYSRANGVLSLFYRSITDALRTVALPELSKRARDKQDLTGPFYKSISYITVLAWPFYGYLYLTSEQVISVLYGEKWLDAAPVLSVLTLMSCISIVFAFGDSFIIAVGLQKYNLHYQLTMTMLTISWLLASSGYGLILLSQGVIIISLLRNLYMYLILKHYLDLKVRHLARTFIKSFLVTTLSLLPVIFYKHLELEFFNSEVFELTCTCILTGITWVTSLFIFKHEITDEIMSFTTKKT